MQVSGAATIARSPERGVSGGSCGRGSGTSPRRPRRKRPGACAADQREAPRARPGRCDRPEPDQEPPGSGRPPRSQRVQDPGAACGPREVPGRRQRPAPAQRRPALPVAPPAGDRPGP